MLKHQNINKYLNKIKTKSSYSNTVHNITYFEVKKSSLAVIQQHEHQTHANTHLAREHIMAQ